MTGGSLSFSLADGGGTSRALAKVPLDQLAVLGLKPGDCIAIDARRRSHARIMPAPRGGQTLEVSPDLIRNLGAASGQDVHVAPAHLSPAESVILQLGEGSAASVDDLSDALHDLPLTEGDQMSLTLRMGRQIEIEVLRVDPSPAGICADNTRLMLAGAPQPDQEYDGIGGMQDEIARVHDMVAIPLLRPDLFDRLGLPAPRGVLFTGPPGCGKTLLARAIAARTSAAFFQINGPEIVSKHYGESEAALRAVFEAAQAAAPAILFIDEIDAIAPARAQLSGEKQVERRVVAQLLTLMDGLAARGQVIVMAATNLPETLDPALRRPGRFDREIGFRPPDKAQRVAILSVHLKSSPLAADVDLSEVAALTSGYVGADLAAVAREASLASLDRTIKDKGRESAVRAEDLHISQQDLLRAVDLTGPSALRGTEVTLPDVHLSDVGGLSTTKQALKEAVIWPFQHRDLCGVFGLGAASGVLISGPPGAGKTLLAKAIAAESGMNFIPIRPSVILSQFLGDAERAISDIFSKARHAAPCLIFFDELDALAPRRGTADAAQDRVVAQLLTELDGLSRNTDVVVLAATNRAAAIDPALTRPGRFDVVLPIDLPDHAAREAILQIKCRDLPVSADVDLSEIAAACAGASGADLAAVVTLAARHALRRKIDDPGQPATITRDDFLAACRTCRFADQARQSDFIARSPQDV